MSSQVYKELQEENAKPFKQKPPVLNNPYILQQSSPNLGNVNIYEGELSSPIQQANSGDYWGKSRYDNPDITTDEWNALYQNPNEIRAQNEGSLAKLGAGIAKGAVLAGTTFIDGTIGLLAGAGTAMVEGRVAGIFDNAISNSLQDINKKMEELLPNYRTQEEMERPWWQNLGTMNFWADSFIKNMGFTIGAFYSGNAWLGALKAAKIVKNAASAQLIGGILSGFNEGRIEANNVKRDVLDLSRMQINDAYNRQYQNIVNSDLSDDEKLTQLEQLKINVDKLYADAEQRSDGVGNETLLFNSLFLPIDNIYQFGKLYSRGFKNAAKITEKSIPRIIGRGLGNAFVEGNEEMMQQFIQSTAGFKRQYDSPDTYYEALTNPDAELRVKDRATAMMEGWRESYGNPQQWEQFAVGFLTGAVGMPTFGRLNNSDRNTYLGRNLPVGLSGGIIGEILTGVENNKLYKQNADVINKYVSKMQDQKDYAVMHESWTNAMDGFAAESNKFEYQNAKDNEDFSAALAYHNLGKFDELREIFNQDFENMSDEKLQEIAVSTTPGLQFDADGNVITKDADGNVLQGGWRNLDGTLMSSTPEGREKMRADLIQRRDAQLNALDLFEQSLEEVQQISHNGLNDSETSELAWLNWKLKTFKTRYGELSEKNENYLNEINKAIEQFQYRQSGKLLEDVNNERINQGKRKLSGRAVNKYKPIVDEDTEEGKKILQYLNTLQEYIGDLKESKTSPLQLSGRISGNEEFIDSISDFGLDLLSDYLESNPDEIKQSLDEIKDMGRLAIAAKSFNDRYEDFKKNPLSIKKNRNKIDQKTSAKAKGKDNINKHSSVSNKTVSDYVQDAKNGVNLDEVKSQFSNDSKVYSEIEQAQEILKQADRLKTQVDSNDNVTEELKDVLNTQIDEVASKAVSPEELKDINSIMSTFNEKATSQQEVDEAARVINDALNTLSEEDKKNIDTLINDDIIKDLESTEEPVSPDEVELEETGNDAVEKSTPENVKEEDKPQISSQTNNIDAFLKSLGIPKEHTINQAVHIILDTLHDKDNTLDKDEFLNMCNTDKNLAGYFSIATNPNFPTVRDFVLNQIDEFYSKTKVEEVTVSSTREKGNEQTEWSNNTVGTGDEDIKYDEEVYDYWKPSTTEYYIYSNGHNPEKTIDFLKRKGYSEKDIHRVEVITRLYEKEGVFDRVNKGRVKKGDKVKFFIDPTINNEVDDFVVFIQDSEGNLIGDLSIAQYARKQTGLLKFIDKIREEYEQAGSPSEKFVSKYESEVGEVYPGMVMYTKDSKTLNDTFKEGKLIIGVKIDEKGNIRTTSGDSKLEWEESIGKTKTGAVGKPFVLVETGSETKHYIPVPFSMRSFAGVQDNSQLGNMVKNNIEAIFNGNISKQRAKEIITTLSDILATQFHLNYSKGGVVKLEMTKDGNRVLLYNGSINQKDSAIPVIINALSGTPFQVSRKYTNQTFNGVDYNSLIGEIAEVNLADTHTVNDYFTLKWRADDGKLYGGKRAVKRDKKAEPRRVRIETEEKEIKPTNVVETAFIKSVVNRSPYNKKPFERLTNEQKQVLYKLKPEDSSRILTSLARRDILKLNDDDFAKKFDELTSQSKPKNRLVEEGVFDKADIQKEVDLMGKLIPQLSIQDRVKVVKGIIEAVEKGKLQRKWGEFSDGMIILSDQAATGTVYHEAFHAVTNVLMSDSERNTMFNEAERVYNISDRDLLEEQLAEGFRKYMQARQTGITGAIKRVFDWLKHVIQSVRGKESYINNLFYRIASGKYTTVNTDLDRIRQKHADNLEYTNLDEEDKEYIKERNISLEEYNKMTQEEKENLLKCRV